MVDSLKGVVRRYGSQELPLPRTALGMGVVAGEYGSGKLISVTDLLARRTLERVTIALSIHQLNRSGRDKFVDMGRFS
ncbi:hypothetical protein DSO57_1034349 [Entomophthora muscae]|uniref:Uncharacterized protein n=1 Tax=Entomophthora muscae TaxID=34485 RepID=A0ACC2TXS5_9FUNG|nr:hypothetical protein DSO57_1034349 [Entomophthora muscae]